MLFKTAAIDLSSNNISGPIPSFFDFSKMPELNRTFDDSFPLVFM